MSNDAKTTTTTTSNDPAPTLAGPETGNIWPPRPRAFPEVMTAVETAQYLRLDDSHRDPKAAKATLRLLRHTRGLPCVGRIGANVLFRKTAVDGWLAAQEAAPDGDSATPHENDN